MAMEALTYERVRLYSDDLPPEEYRKWQPRILLRKLLEIDPLADQSSSISYGIEPSLGEKPKKMNFLGKEEVLNLKTIEKHYDALGSYLHMETLYKLENGKMHDLEKLRSKCEAIADAIDLALASRVWNSNFKVTSDIECMECGKLIRRRFQQGSDDMRVSCFHCKAEYILSEGKNKKVRWKPCQKKINCLTKKCEGTMVLWEGEIERGTSWQCQTCEKRFRIDLVVQLVDDASDTETST